MPRASSYDTPSSARTGGPTSGLRAAGARAEAAAASPVSALITSASDSAARDRVADTPHHKHVPVRLHAAPADAALNTLLPMSAAAH